MSDGMKILPGQVTQLTSHEVESENRMVRQFAGCGFNGKAAPPLPIPAPGHGQGTEEERVERAALEYIVSRWRRQIGPPDPVWHLMHDVHMMRPEGCVEYVVERCRILAAADAVPGPEVEWTGSAFERETLARMGEQVRTQDNAITGDPIFMVQRRRRIYGMDTAWDGETAWLSEDGDYEAEADERHALEEWHIKTGDDEHDGFRRLGFIDIWENVQPFFTRVGAEHYIKINGHNLRPETRIFVESGYRNAEWQVIRELLKRWPVPISAPPVTKGEGGR